jgi:hypothetical protein
MAETYSFLSVSASIVGPNGSFSLSDGNTEGGISFAKTGPKNTKTVGADGTVMNSLHADESGTITIRLLKTSITNAMLQSMYDGDRSDPRLWGKNQIKIRDVARGDSVTATGCAFQKFPDVTYDKEGPALEWVIDAGSITTTLGAGL